MLRKLVSVMLAFIMGWLSIPLEMQTAEQRRSNVNDSIISFEDNGDVVVSTEAEGSIISCKYSGDTQKYYLYRDDAMYQVSVDVVDGCALVDIIDTNESKGLPKGYVRGQDVVVLAYACWTLAAVTAA